MKKITIRVEPVEKGAKFKTLSDYVLSTYPTDQCDIDPEGALLEGTFIFYARTEARVMQWFELTPMEFGFEIKSKKVELLSPSRYKAIRKRLDF